MRESIPIFGTSIVVATRLSEFEALVAVRHLTEAVRAEVQALRGQAKCG